MTHLTEEQLVLHYYGDAESAAEVEAHLAQCPACGEEYASLQRLLNTLDSVPVAERGAWLTSHGFLVHATKKEVSVIQGDVRGTAHLG